jgi:homoserine/homoserine lactone efflux protein
MSFDLYVLYLVTLGIYFATPPGPSQLLMIANSARHGWRSSLATAAGDLSANALQMTAAAFGLAALIGTSAQALTVLKWAGVAYLVWMGIRIYRAPFADPSRARTAATRGQLFRQGFITSAANPKAVFFFAALFPQFIDARLPIWPQLAILGATYILVDGTLLVLYGATSAWVLGKLQSRLSRWQNRITGALLIGAAILLALKDVHLAARR